MKFLAVFVLAALAISAHALTDEEKDKVKAWVGECITKTSVEKELISKARASEYTERNAQLAAYYTCMMEKMAFQKADGTFDTDRMAEKLPGSGDRDTAIKAIKKCDAHDAALSKEDNAMNFMYCFYKAVGKDFKLL